MHCSQSGRLHVIFEALAALRAQDPGSALSDGTVSAAHRRFQDTRLTSEAEYCTLSHCVENVQASCKVQR